MYRSRSHALAASVVALLVVLAAPAAEAKSKIFTLEDPRGDDHGNGKLIYPVDNMLNQGELDLLSLTAKQVKGGTEIEVIYAKPVRTPGPAAGDSLGTPLDQILRHGFINQLLDIYIDIDREPGSGGVGMLPGRKALIAPEFAWDKAVVLSPQPYEARLLLERIYFRQLKEELRADDPELLEEEAEQLREALPADLARRVFFPTRVRVRGPIITFFVPDSFLGGPMQADWGYVVASSGADVLQRIDSNVTDSYARELLERFMILPVAPDEWRNRFGGGREDDLQPAIIDLIVPPGERQEALLSDFNDRQDRRAELPGVVPSQLQSGGD